MEPDKPAMYHRTRYNYLPLRSNRRVVSPAAPTATLERQIGLRGLRADSRWTNRFPPVPPSRVTSLRASNSAPCNFDSEKGETGTGYEVLSLRRPWCT